MPDARNPADPAPALDPLRFPAGRAGRRRFVRVAVLAAALAAAALGGAEALWRARGVRPSVPDSGELWAWHRLSVRDGGGSETERAEPTVLVGSSRVQWGFDPDTFARRFPNRRLVQLSVVGDDATAALADLAADESFHGTVIAGFLEEPPVPVPGSAVADYVRVADRGLGVVDRAELTIQAAASGCVTRRTECSWQKVLAGLLKGRGLPGDTRWTRGFDRHPRLVPGRASEDGEPIDPWRDVPESRWTAAQWRDRAAAQLAAARRIAARGGRVIFVRFPTSGPLRERVARRYPKSEFWDEFVARLAAADRVTPGRLSAVHYEDVPALRDFDAPDGSHVSLNARPAFTAALLDELERRGGL